MVVMRGGRRRHQSRLPPPLSRDGSPRRDGRRHSIVSAPTHVIATRLYTASNVSRRRLDASRSSLSGDALLHTCLRHVSHAPALSTTRETVACLLFAAVAQRLREQGTFAADRNDCGAPKRRRLLELEEAVLHLVEQIPSASTRTIARAMGAAPGVVWEVLHEQQLHLCHLQRLRSSGPADFAPRVDLDKWFLRHCTTRACSRDSFCPRMHVYSLGTVFSILETAMPGQTKTLIPRMFGDSSTDILSICGMEGTELSEWNDCIKHVPPPPHPFRQQTNLSNIENERVRFQPSVIWLCSRLLEATGTLSSTRESELLASESVCFEKSSRDVSCNSRKSATIAPKTPKGPRSRRIPAIKPLPGPERNQILDLYIRSLGKARERAMRWRVGWQTAFRHMLLDRVAIRCHVRLGSRSVARISTFPFCFTSFFKTSRHFLFTLRFSQDGIFCDTAVNKVKPSRDVFRYSQRERGVILQSNVWERLPAPLRGSERLCGPSVPAAESGSGSACACYPCKKKNEVWQVEVPREKGARKYVCGLAEGTGVRGFYRAQKSMTGNCGLRIRRGHIVNEDDDDDVLEDVWSGMMYEGGGGRTRDREEEHDDEWKGSSRGAERRGTQGSVCVCGQTVAPRGQERQR
ncbi:hypothetical protein PR048_030057 [Dryococelus australis]|uniref:Uncharacterized protein n=1 Tax=Dryococelus australis TaxID=614101 RepID=A0ABQ9GBS1_9NEOP|nr:hypothetical protein PR048_030057 [Dryococelus australis]